jgi:hypothetical protein
MRFFFTIFKMQGPFLIILQNAGIKNIFNPFSPLVGLTTEDFTVGQAALKTDSNKVVKHERACSDNEHVFIPFAFDTFGFLASEAVNILKRV